MSEQVAQPQVNQESEPSPEVVEVPKEEVKPDPLAEQFQRLSKQEKHLSEQRKQMEEAKKGFEVERALADEMKLLKDLRTKDPVAVLEKLGLTVDELNVALQARNQPQDPLAKKVRQIEEELYKEKESKKMAEEVANRERMQRAELALNAEIDKTIAEHEFDLIPTLGMQKSVIEFMEEVYNTTGEVPSVKEACEAVTNHIVGLYQKASVSKWVKPKVEEVIKKEEPKSPNTVSNKLSQAIVGADKPMNDAQRLQAAIRAMEMTKK